MKRETFSNDSNVGIISSHHTTYRYLPRRFSTGFDFCRMLVSQHDPRPEPQVVLIVYTSAATCDLRPA